MSGGLRSLFRECRDASGLPRAVPWPAGERPLQSYLGTRKATPGVLREVWAEMSRERRASESIFGMFTRLVGLRKQRRERRHARR